MAEKIKLEIVTPDAMVVSEEVDEFTASGSEGDFGVLPGHCPMLSALKTGELSYKQGETEVYLALGGGYADVGSEKVAILVESAERAADIDREMAGKAVSDAEERLKKLSAEDEEYDEAQKALELATVRLSVAERCLT